MANFSLFAIPVYWLLCLLPHSYAVLIMQMATNWRWDNSNPRSSKWDATMRESTPAEVYARYERAEAAHKNGMESLPIFVGAVLAGNISNLDSSDLNNFVVAYLCLRVVYTVVYISVSSPLLSIFRDAIWIVSSSMCSNIFFRGGYALARRS